MSHSILSPSGHKRWRNCPASVGMQLQHPETGSSDAAREGTVAHRHLEHRLIRYKDGLRKLKFNGRVYPDYKDFPVTKEMDEAVDTAFDTIIAVMNESKIPKKDLFIERHLSINTIHFDCYGTADVVLLDRERRRVYVMDYKHGQGVRVAPNDDQLFIYGVGVLDTLNLWNKVDDVVCVVIQPRVHNWVPEFISYDIDEVRERAQIIATDADNAYRERETPQTFNPGEEQCRWCSAASECEAYEDKVMEVLANDFDTKSTWQEKLDKIPLLKTWIRSIENQALAKAQEEKIEGYKIVRTVKNRTWKYPEEEIAEQLMDILPIQVREEIYHIKIATPAQIEKVLSKLSEKDTLQELVAGLIERPQGNLVLTSESDSRPEVTDQNGES